MNAPNLVDLQRDLKTDAIEELIPIYTPNSALLLNINLRGLLATAAFAANSTTLILDIPNAGITKSFTGGTRDESLQLLKSFIVDGGNNNRLLRAYSKYSPIDPMAGNPNSLMALMAESDYQLARLYPQKGCECCYASQPVLHEFQTGASFVRGFSKDFETSSATLPFRYSYSPCRTWALIFDAPLTYNKTGGASSLSGSLGVALQYPVSKHWTLTPVFRLGSGGSLDLCTSSGFLSAGVTSTYDFRTQAGVFSLLNYAGFTNSINLWITGINWNYNLHNFIFKNGFVFTTCEGISLCNRIFNGSVSFEDTVFTHDSLYIMHYDEIGLSLITSQLNPRLCWDSLTFGFSYQFGEKEYKGYCFRLHYYF